MAASTVEATGKGEEAVTAAGVNCLKRPGSHDGGGGRGQKLWDQKQLRPCRLEKEDPPPKKIKDERLQLLSMVAPQGDAKGICNMLGTMGSKSCELQFFSNPNF